MPLILSVKSEKKKEEEEERKAQTGVISLIPNYGDVTG